MGLALPTIFALAAVVYAQFLNVLTEGEKRRRHYSVMLVLDGLTLLSSGLLLVTVGPTVPLLAVVFGIVVLFRSLSALGAYGELSGHAGIVSHLPG